MAPSVDDWLFGSGGRNQNAKRRVGRLAERQFGRVGWFQVRRLGVGKATVNRWVHDGYLHRVLPGVYAVGHLAPSVEGDLAAALLYAGPGATLSHATAAWWLGLLKRKPFTVDVTTPRRCRPLPNFRVHDRRQRDRIWRNGLPVTTVEDTLVDFAAEGSFDSVRRVLAEADYRRLLNTEAIETALQQRRPGSTILRRALKQHLPGLARTRSELEVAFVLLCETAGIPLPEINVIVAGVRVDAFWREQRLVVELDGIGNHGTPAQIERDRRNELTLRQAGMFVLRYTSEQMRHQTELVSVDVLAAYARHDVQPR